jgi:serine/threonine protein kinase
MNEHELDLSSLSLSQLKEIAREFDIDDSNLSRSSLAKKLEHRYYELKKYIGYTYIRQLGFKGADGRTFLARSESDGNEYAVKVFKNSKNPGRIKSEIELQNLASAGGISPRIIDYNARGRYIVMEKLDTTLFQLFRRQGNKLTKRQQKEMIRCFEELDRCGIFHGDPNPCNFMKRDSDHKFFAIDFGFSKKIGDSVIRKHGSTPNMKYMPLGLILKLREVEPSSRFDVLERYSFVGKK